MSAKFLKLNIKLGARSYPILIGAGAIQQLSKHCKGKKVFVLSDERLTEARALVMKTLASKNVEAHEIPLKAGESLKDIESIYPIYGELLNLKANRDSVIIALGGGSIGDAVGFIAASFMRGIEWIGIPTTLLAQVDSSVGGKTGINHSAGKNLIGAFHQPSLVICDTTFLKTLGPRELVSGLGEIIKYAITFDPPFFSYLEKNVEKLLKSDEPTLKYCIQRSLYWKCKAVAKDELDRKGTREILNFGHTFGHALETATEYQEFQHGEAVIWGMRFALALSQQRKRLAAKTREKIDSLLLKLQIPSLPSNLPATHFFSLMKKDKKAQGNTVRFVLIDRLGHSVSDSKVTEKDLQSAFDLLVQPQEGTR